MISFAFDIPLVDTMTLGCARRNFLSSLTTGAYYSQRRLGLIILVNVLASVWFAIAISTYSSPSFGSFLLRHSVAGLLFTGLATFAQQLPCICYIFPLPRKFACPAAVRRNYRRAAQRAVHRCSRRVRLAEPFVCRSSEAKFATLWAASRYLLVVSF